MPETADEIAGSGYSTNAFLAATLGTVSDNPRVDALLERQIALSDLQIENLKKQDEYETSHLRWRRFNDQMKGALQIMLIAAGALVVIGVGAMMWNAAWDRDLVVEPFSVPADIAQSGITGAAIAGRVLDRYGEMQGETYSLSQGAGSYRSDDGNQVRVEIPSTGVSVGELNGYLRQWLGHETHATGDLAHKPGGGYALTVRVGGNPGRTVESPDLATLIDLGAESLYRGVHPLRFADYLVVRRRPDEALAIIVPLAGTGSAREQAQAYLSWSTALRASDGHGALDKAIIATRLDPSNAAAWFQLDAAAYNVGHRETALKAEQTVLALLKAGRTGDLDPDLAAILPPAITADYDIDKGDPAGSLAACSGEVVKRLDCGNVFIADFQIVAHDLAEAARVVALVPLKDRDGKPRPAARLLRSRIAMAEEDWPAAIALVKQADAIEAARPEFSGQRISETWPQLATAMARNGQNADAQALIAKTPLDCDPCIIARGTIASEKRDWKTANHWFAMVSARQPDLYLADQAWGTALLRGGNTEAALAKFIVAHRKAPKNADALVGWGEALILKNRSDLALAKFEEASRYAPQWGRLHLKWGEALTYAGRKDQAARQFALAAALDLAPSETSELDRMRQRRG